MIALRLLYTEHEPMETCSVYNKRRALTLDQYHRFSTEKITCISTVVNHLNFQAYTKQKTHKTYEISIFAEPRSQPDYFRDTWISKFARYPDQVSQVSRLV